MKLEKNSPLLWTIFVVLISLSSAFAGPLQWKITRQWSPSEEKLFSEFISNIGQAVRSRECLTTDDCLRSPKANPFFSKNNPQNLGEIFSDCADLPYILRGYFAFMRELPFVFPTGVTFFSVEIDETRAAYYVAKREYDRYRWYNRPREVKKRFKELEDKLEELLKAAGKDIRYSKTGNRITSLKKIEGGENINSILKQVVNSISTASFRVDSRFFDSGSVFKDTYSIKINRDAIKPGTILYDPSGHIGVVANITENGKIYLIDAHPDNSITYISYGEKFSRSPVNRGAGFVNWRPYTFSQGKYYPVPNDELEDFGLVQFYGNPEREGVDYRRARYSFEGQEMNFHHFVRASLSLQGLTIKPLEELTVNLDDLCRDFQDRVLSVEKAINDGISEKEHPNKMPENIYGTDGEWETYSTPSRDARLKASVREIYQSIEEYLNPELSPNLQFEYQGSNIKEDLYQIFLNKTSACSFSFKKSNGEIFQTNLRQSLKDLFNLSYNPYHCIELRWGLGGSDLSSCQQSQDKWEWYEVEAPMRNQIDRDYSAFMGYDLDGFRRSGLGVESVPEIDIESLLSELP